METLLHLLYFVINYFDLHLYFQIVNRSEEWAANTERKAPRWYIYGLLVKFFNSKHDVPGMIRF